MQITQQQPAVAQLDTTNNSSATEAKIEVMANRDSQGDDSMEDCEATANFYPTANMAESEVMNDESFVPPNQTHTDNSHV